MIEVAIVSTASTPIKNAFSSAFNMTNARATDGCVIAQAAARAELEGDEIDDVILSASFQAGNICRMSALAAGLIDGHRRKSKYAAGPPPRNSGCDKASPRNCSKACHDAKNRRDAKHYLSTAGIKTLHRLLCDRRPNPRTLHD